MKQRVLNSSFFKKKRLFSRWHRFIWWVIGGLILLPFAFLTDPASAQSQRPFVDCEDVTQVPLEECEALKLFFISTKGETWQFNSGWMFAGQPCEWYGVTCESGPWPRNVTKITLIDNNLGGAIPTEISFLTELEELVITNSLTAGYFSSLGGWIPTTIGDLEHLEVVQLSGNQMVGPIPSTVGSLQNLRILHLDGNRFEGIIPDSLGFLTQLEELVLTDNKFHGRLPTTLGQLENLQRLELGFNNFSGEITSELGRLKNLRNLDLQSNAFSGALPVSLGELENLTVLRVSDNRLSRPPPPQVIKRVSELQVCSLENNDPGFCIPDAPVWEGEAQGTVCNVPVEATCSFCSNESGEVDSSCQGLESFYFATNGLNWLDNSGWLANENPCGWFGIGCESDRITEIVLPENNLSGAIPEALSTLDSLFTLDLSGNRLEGSVPLPVALLGLKASSCSLLGNTSSLCIPEYPDLGTSSVCGLPAETSCRIDGEAAQFLSVEVVSDDVSRYLTWRLSTASANAVIEIEKLDPVGNYLLFDSVPIDGESVSSLEFSYGLERLEAGIHTFRLRLVENNGSTVLSPEIVVTAHLADGGYLVEAPYPNPFSHTATFRFSIHDQQSIGIFLFDSTGRQIRSIYQGEPEPDTVYSVDISSQNLAAGLYFLHIKGERFGSTHSLVLRK